MNSNDCKQILFLNVFTKEEFLIKKKRINFREEKKLLLQFKKKHFIC